VHPCLPTDQSCDLWKQVEWNFAPASRLSKQDFQEAAMTRWHDTMVDRPESDHEAGYAAGWTISGLAMLGAIVTVWVFAI
jgi:hypothetical protein